MFSYEIIDDNGVLYSDDEDTIRETYQDILDGQIELDWVGDLKLIQVISRYK